MISHKEHEKAQKEEPYFPCGKNGRDHFVELHEMIGERSAR